MILSKINIIIFIMTLLEKIKMIDYNYCKGLEYEKYALTQLYKYYDIEEAYLWKHVPYNLLVEANIIMQDDNFTIKQRYKMKHRNYNVLLDTGIDIICKLTNGNIILVQCKAYSNSVVSQKHLAGFYRTLLDSILFNNNHNRKYTISGLIVHTTTVSDIITSSYCYNQKIIRDLYVPIENEEEQSISTNKLKGYKDITFIINTIFFLINIALFLQKK